MASLIVNALKQHSFVDYLSKWCRKPCKMRQDVLYIGQCFENKSKIGITSSRRVIKTHDVEIYKRENEWNKRFPCKFISTFTVKNELIEMYALEQLIHNLLKALNHQCNTNYSKEIFNITPLMSFELINILFDLLNQSSFCKIKFVDNIKCYQQICKYTIPPCIIVKKLVEFNESSVIKFIDESSKNKSITESSANKLNESLIDNVLADEPSVIKLINKSPDEISKNKSIDESSIIKLIDESNDSSSINSVNTVFITKYGKCYHSINNCGKSKHVEQIILSSQYEINKITSNYRPCSICKPYIRHINDVYTNESSNVY